MKHEGTFAGTDVYSDPNAAPGMVYFVNEKNLVVGIVDSRSDWQRVKDWFSKLFKRS